MTRFQILTLQNLANATKRLLVCLFVVVAASYLRHACVGAQLCVFVVGHS